MTVYPVFIMRPEEHYQSGSTKHLLRVPMFRFRIIHATNKLLTRATSSFLIVLYRRGEHFGVQQVCTDILDG